MRTLSVLSSTTKRASLGLSVSVIALFMGAGTCMAQEGVFMRDVFGKLGIIDGPKDEIVYRERPPLVVPPKNDLRAPVNAEEVAASNPAWPNDPDALARRKAETLARVPVTETERYKLEKNPRLSIEEIRAGRKVGAGIPDGPELRPGDSNLYELYYKPMQQGRDMAKNQTKTEDALLTYGQEPERKYLTEPPKGLRLPATTAAIPKKTTDIPAASRDDVDQVGFARRGQ